MVLSFAYGSAAGHSRDRNQPPLARLLLVLLIIVACVARGGRALDTGLDNGLARTPPMGWISWARFTCNIDCHNYADDCISEKLYKDMADRMAADGYAALGYKYVNIDDCWALKVPRTTLTQPVCYRTTCVHKVTQQKKSLC